MKAPHSIKLTANDVESLALEHPQSLTAIEAFCIRSLVYYASTQCDVMESVIEALLVEKLAIDEVTEIDRHSYDEAVDFLVNLTQEIQQIN